MAFTFKKNERGYSDLTFPVLRKVIIGTTNRLFNVRVTNRHNMPLTGPCFIYGNHSNYFDPFFINSEMTVEPTAGIMTRDQFHKTFPRIFMDSVGIVPTSKYVPEPGIIRSVMKMIDQKRMIVIFPEGGRRWDGRPKPLIETTLKLFWKMRIPVHPVQLHGSWLGWPRWAGYPRKSSVEARFLDPLNASDFESIETFSDVCRSKMTFEEYTPPVEAFPFNSWKPASGIERFLYRCPESGESAHVYSPDGYIVRSHSGRLNYTLNHASRLVDAHGEPHSLMALYDRIRQMEMQMNADGILLREPGSRFFKIGRDHSLIPVGHGQATLLETGIAYQFGSESGHIPIDEIRYLSVDQNHKLSVTDNHRTLQFTVRKFSALQWQHYIRRLINGEKPGYSTIRTPRIPDR